MKLVLLVALCTFVVILAGCGGGGSMTTSTITCYDFRLQVTDMNGTPVNLDAAFVGTRVSIKPEWAPKGTQSWQETWPDSSASGTIKIEDPLGGEVISDYNEGETVTITLKSGKTTVEALIKPTAGDEWSDAITINAN